MAYRIWLNEKDGKVIVSDMAEALEKAGFEVRMEYVDSNDAEKIVSLGKWADAVISGLELWNRDNLEAVKDHLKFIFRFGTGCDNIDIPAATDFGILVGNIPGANATPVAELALLHMLNLERHFEKECFNDNRPWVGGSVGSELDGKCIGIIGFGNIGKELRRMLRGFNVTVYAYDPFLTIDEDEYQVKMCTDYKEIFKRCDFISLHVPLTEQTANMVNSETLSIMKPTAYLINTCRGGVVDEQALRVALAKGVIAGAGLDVTSIEPGGNPEPLRTLKNTTITPHSGGMTAESIARSKQMLIQGIKDFFNGKEPFHMMNPEVLRQCKQRA